MSLETEVKNLTAAIIALTQVVQGQHAQPAQQPVQPVQQGFAAPPAQPSMPQQGFAPPAPQQGFAPPQGMPQMPAAPQFAPPGGNGQFPAQQAVQLPFNDTPSLVLYATNKYKQLGPERGQQIQALIQQMGFSALNQIPPDRYGQVYQAIESLGV